MRRIFDEELIILNVQAQRSSIYAKYEYYWFQKFAFQLNFDWNSKAY